MKTELRGSSLPQLSARTTLSRYLRFYASSELHHWDEEIDPDVELTRALAVWERQLGSRPTVLFTNVRGFPGRLVLGNPYPRGVILASMGLDIADWPQVGADRLSQPSPGTKLVERSWQFQSDLRDVPMIRHRPGDAGPYLTAGVAVTKTRATGRLNLGVYRVQVVGPKKALIFFDPKTDAFSNWADYDRAGEPMPIAIFLGASPVHALVAAAKLPADEDDYEVSARLTNETVGLTGDLPVPTDASLVIYGRVLPKLETEGPFAEFKGYYVPARLSNVLEVDAVHFDEDSVLPTIVTGAESGLTLMAMQNELLAFHWLTQRGFCVSSVQYPLYARGEFLGLIESDRPTQEMLDAAMQRDPRCKITIVGKSLPDPWDVLATHPFDAKLAEYRRKGEAHGDRIGVLVGNPPEGRSVEF